MKRITFLCVFIPLLAVAILGSGAPPLSAANTKPSASASTTAKPKPRMLFDKLLPTSFQKEPLVDFNVVTDMTEYGRTFPQPTPQRPVYYLAHSAGFHALGQNAPAGEKPPAVEQMEIFMKDALKTAGYLPEAPDHPASILLIYYWGSYTALSPDATDDVNQDEKSGPVLVRELFERARVVGGDKFAQDLMRALIESHNRNLGSRPPKPDPTGLVDPIPDVRGDLAGNFASFFDPLQIFMDASPRNRHLVEEAYGSIYFVITTAYDYESVVKNDKKALWRTKMSVSANGVSLGETLPPLIANGAAFFGRDMKEAQVIPQRLLREGRVEIGEPTVEFIEEPAPAATDESKPAEKPRDAAKP